MAKQYSFHYKSLCLGLCLLLGASLQGQTFKAWVKAAEKAEENKDFFTALRYYENALEMDSTQTDLWMEYGDIAQQFNAYQLAEKAFGRVIASEKAKDYPLSSFKLAMIKHKLGKYSEAIDLYNNYLNQKEVLTIKSAEIKGIDYKKEAEICIGNCQKAIELIDNETSKKEVRQLNTSINTIYSEYAPLIKGDTLYYSSLQYIDEKDKHAPPRVYSKLFKTVQEGIGEILPPTVNPDLKHSAHTAFSLDDTKMYFTLCDYVGITEVRCDLYSAERLSKDNWSTPKALKSLNVSGATSTQPTIAYDQQLGSEILYFTSDRVGGKGGLDIWYALIDETGSIGKATNLSDLNTEKDDLTPFFHTNTQTLYFSSNGYDGLGEYDVFKSQKQKQTWGKVTHLDSPINSSFNDIYFYVNEKGDKAYFSSNRIGSTYLVKEKEACCNDIYQVDLETYIDLLVSTFDDSTKLDLNGATVELYEIRDGVPVLIDSKTLQGENDFNFTLVDGKDYVIIAKKDGYIQAKETIRTSDFVGQEKIERKLYLEPLVFKLEILVFENTDDENDNGTYPLNNATVKLFAIPAGLDTITTNETGHDFLFPIALGKLYPIEVSRKGFQTYKDSIDLRAVELDASQTFTAKVFLDRISFDDYLPLAVYFDNDKPDSRTRKTTTNSTYPQTYTPYYSRKEIFKETFIEPMEGEERYLNSKRFDIFFEREVKEGYEKLERFSGDLLRYLSRGKSLNIEFEGYASPRSTPDYNDLLSQRRIHSVSNYFRNYAGGAMVPYMDNGQLMINQKAFGESKASNTISAELYDERGSIYSVGASIERRVEIVEVKSN